MTKEVSSQVPWQLPHFYASYLAGLFKACMGPVCMCKIAMPKGAVPKGASNQASPIQNFLNSSRVFARLSSAVVPFLPP